MRGVAGADEGWGIRAGQVGIEPEGLRMGGATGAIAELPVDIRAKPWYDSSMIGGEGQAVVGAEGP